MTAQYGHHRLTADEIATYAGMLSLDYSAPNYAYNLAHPGLHYDDWCAVTKEIARRERVAAIEAFDTTPEIRKYLLDHADKRGARKPERADETAFFKRCVEVQRSAFGRPVDAYKPEKGACGIKMQPAQGVLVSTTQESYSDDSYVAVPYTVTAGKPADKAVFARNVSALVRRGNTHNGWAGSGCTYEATVHDGFVLIYCRASIAD